MYLLDTNVVSELRKVRLGKADGHVADWADSMDASWQSIPQLLSVAPDSMYRTHALYVRGL